MTIHWVAFGFTIVDIDVHISKGKAPKKLYPPVSPWKAFELFGQVGLSIALPLVAGAMIGAYLDGQWGTKPQTTLAGIGIGTIVSMISFWTTVKQFMRTYKK